MTIVESTAGAIPSQELLDGLMADAQGIADTIASVFGAEMAYVTIGIRAVPADVFHALPHASTVADAVREDGTHYAWKQVAHGPSISRISVDCADDHTCPERQP